MLAALLLNLENEVVRQDNGFVTINFGGGARQLSVAEAADKIEALLGALDPTETKPKVKRTRKAVRKARKALTAPQVDLTDFTNAQAELGVLLFELRESLPGMAAAFSPESEKWRQVIAYLRGIQALIDEEEALIALLLA